METVNNQVWCGFDVGKKKFSAALDLPDASNRKKLTSLPQKDFERTPAGVTKFFAWQGKIVASGSKISIVMETTGCYSQQLASWLSEYNPSIPVSIENARNIHCYIQSLNLPHKTDALDAKAIARYGTERMPKPTKLLTKTVMELRELTRERTALIKARVRLGNRRESLNSSLVRRINGQTLAALTRQIERLDKEIKACVVQNEDIINEVHILTTMPGVSFISAYSILAEIGSLSQYSAKELSSLSGLAPRIRESGTSVHSSCLSRRSSGRLRQILYLDSITAVQKVPYLSELYNRLTARGKKKMTARCACMRKLLLILRAMVVNKKPFDEKFYKKTLKAI